MRFSIFSIGLLAVSAPLATAWSKEDREIFRVRDELMSHIGPETTFYDFLGITPQATLDEINKAYRKKTRSLHPDKVKQQLTAERVKKDKAAAKKAGSKKPVVSKPPSQSEVRAAVKKAGDMQARLSIVANILRGADRDRYDHFLANGFPTWKGTGYYYNRYRPGFGTVLFGLFLFGGGGAHYVALYMGWKRRREFVERYIEFARHAAWGENLGINLPGVDAVPAQVPPPPPQGDEDERQMPMNRKQRRLQERETKREQAKEQGSKRGRAGRAAAAAALSGSATPTPQAQAGGPTGSRKRVVAENGKVLVVDSLGDVYLEQEDEDGRVAEFLLDPNELPCPTFRDTAVYRLPAWAYGAVAGRLRGGKTASRDDESDDESGSNAEEVRKPLRVDSTARADEESSEPGKATPSTDSNEDFELLEKSTDSLGQAKATGNQPSGGKSKKRKANKKK